MNYYAVVNPSGASGKTGREWKHLEPEIRSLCPGLKVHYSTRERGIGELCRRIEERSARSDSGTETVIVVVGGDGSFNEAVNGVKDPENVIFALLPCGSGNDFRRDMGWPEDLTVLAERLFRNPSVREMDIGELLYVDTGEVTRFNVSSGIGFDAATCELAGRSRLKDIMNRAGLGSLIYLESAFRVIGSQKSLPAKITVDGAHYCFEHFLFACAMNHCYEGGGFQFAPEADPSDGILNMCVASPPHNAEFYRVFPSVPSGKHFQKYSFLHDLRGRRIEIETSIPLWVHTDGEVHRRSDHILVQCMDQKLRLLS